ncbi:MAG: sulfotransferase domain-containing protein [Deltaproteobacteria bacterium]|nr:sulfotransferase domain-containing protein [Deltaproteobacteria bacterium]
MRHDQLPNFIIIGAAKGGTTSLHAYLVQHPQIFMTSIKETNFFCKDSEFERGLDWYLDFHFRGGEAYPFRGEASPRYLYSDQAPERMAGVFSDAPVRFLVVLRDPVERAYSWYWHLVRNGNETLGFEEALARESERLPVEAAKRIGSLRYAYVDSGMYAKQLRRWFEHFPSERFLVVLHEELVTDTVAVLGQVFDFLGVTPQVDIDVTKRRNVASLPRSRVLQRAVLEVPVRVGKWVGPLLSRRAKDVLVRRYWAHAERILRMNQRPFDKPDMNPDTEARLRERFAEDILDLQEILGRDLSGWLPRSSTGENSA